MASRFTLPGKIYLTAIGPGPAKRLTLRTLELLRRADLIVHDDQVPSDVLELVPPHVAVLRMTKEPGTNSRTHEEIQRRMAEAARNGQCVVRLIFGGIPSDRDAQREIIILRERGIEAELLAGTPWAAAEAGA
jgi:siroheme synthase